MTRCIFVNRFFHPDISATSQMVSDLAFQLAASGHDVSMVASRLRYDDTTAILPQLESISGVTIHRVWTSRFGRASLPGRLVDYLTFYITAPWKVLRLARRGDIVIVKTDPPLISVPVMIAARMKGARHVNWLQDVFPEVATALGMGLGGALSRTVLTGLRNRSLASAHCNVAIGERMAERLRPGARTAPVRVIANWSPTDDIVPIPRDANPLAGLWQMGKRFVVGYSGNLGRAHDLAVVLEAAARLRHRQDIVVLIIGEGNQKDALRERAVRMGLANVLFKPYQPKDQLKYSLTLPDVHLVSLKPALEGLIVPSKFYSSIAAGRPVIFLGAADGEVARDILRADCGSVVPPDDPTSLARAIEALADHPSLAASKGENARKLFEREYTRESAFKKWSAVLEEGASM
jgi:glycosyltransferase involved in cell wall biosynthesis